MFFILNFWTRKDEVGQRRAHFSQNFFISKVFHHSQGFILFWFFLAAEIQSGLVEHDSLLLLSKTSAVVQGRFRRQR